MKKQKKTFDGDDGRVVANMNVDGMPWYMRSRKPETPQNNDLSDLTKEETREIIKGAMKAGLLVGSVFFVGFLVFILICVLIWS